MATIKFHFQSKKFSIPNKYKLKKFLEYIFDFENKLLKDLNIIFSSDEYLLGLNNEYLNHDFYTDILTFDLSSDAKHIIGEIYISHERIEENARVLKISFLDEVYRVMFHGVLHLCGYVDSDKKFKKQMTGKENYYLNLYLSHFF